MSSHSNAVGTTRRTIVMSLPGLAVALTALPALALQPPRRPAPSEPVFFTALERAFVTAAVDRLLPADELGPGGVAAEVPRYIDLQLAGPWGRGDGRYVAGPMKDGPPTLGDQAIMSRATLYRMCIAALRTLPAGRDFADADPTARDAFLRSLQQGEHEGNQMQGKKFFATLLEDSVSGFMADPSYGGNAGFVGWKLIGYPGVRYDWAPYLKNDGRALDLPLVGTFGPADGYGLE